MNENEIKNGNEIKNKIINENEREKLTWTIRGIRTSKTKMDIQMPLRMETSIKNVNTADIEIGIQIQIQCWNGITTEHNKS